MESVGDQLRRAIADLWSQPIESGADYVVFYDHFGNPARIREQEGAYLIAWAVESPTAGWDEYGRRFDNPRQAALHAFQGPEKGRS